MLRDTIFIAGKDLKTMFRARETILWVFMMPIIFFYFIGSVTAGFRGEGKEPDRLAVITGGEEGFLFDQVVRRLEERNFEIVRPEGDEDLGRFSRRLLIPPAFTDSVLAGRPVTLRFVRREGGPMNEFESIRARRAVYTVLADVVVCRQMEGGLSPACIEDLNEWPRALAIDVKPAGRRKEIPSGFEQAIPGIMVMFILLVMTTSGAILLVIERRQGLLRRLACTPIRRISLVLGKWGGKMTTGAIQIGFAMLAGTLLFGMDWGPDLGWVIFVLLAYAAGTASLGIILGSIARSDGQAAAIGVISSNVLAALGGCWWPIEITPPWMQRLQLFLPTGWAMDAMHKLISFGSGPSGVVPHMIGMSVFSLVMIVLASKIFRYD